MSALPICPSVLVTWLIVFLAFCAALWLAEKDLDAIVRRWWGSRVHPDSSVHED